MYSSSAYLSIREHGSHEKENPTNMQNERQEEARWHPWWRGDAN